MLSIIVIVISIIASIRPLFKIKEGLAMSKSSDKRK